MTERHDGSTALTSALAKSAVGVVFEWMELVNGEEDGEEDGKVEWAPHLSVVERYYTQYFVTGECVGGGEGMH